MITACRSGKYITRNASHFKVVSFAVSGVESTADDDEDLVFTDDQQEMVDVSAGMSQIPDVNDSIGPRCSIRSRTSFHCFGQNIYE